jgi:glycosyltransferase involved in cell wall biosynthesis
VVAAAYAAARVFAFPSRTDTQALVLQEAALSGVPVVMVDPVLHRVCPLGGHAVLTDPEPDAFATATTRLLNEPRRARALASAAATRAAGHTPAGYAAAVHDAYAHARAMGGRPAACHDGGHERSARR